MATVFKRGGKRTKGPWYAAWYDHNGKRKTKSTKTTDKATAERIAKKLEAAAALRRDGVIDPALDAISQESQRAVESHLSDYESTLRGRGSTDNHVSRTLRMVRKIAELAEWRIASDINAASVDQFADHLKNKGRAARTVQSHLTAIKGFTKWLAANQKLPRDPLASVKKPNPSSDRRHERRMLLPEEWQWLRSTLGQASERFGMAADERLVLYVTAIETGLRSGELRELTRRSLFLGEKDPHVVAKASTTKNRKMARQHIRRELADELEALTATKAPGAALLECHSQDLQFADYWTPSWRFLDSTLI